MTGFVYFALHEDDRRELGLVKIGWAKDNPERRVCELQTGNPYRLNYLGAVPGSLADEAWAHSQLAAHRIRGEWFRLEHAWEVIVFWTALAGVSLGDVIAFVRDELDGLWDQTAVELAALAV